jgi:hypothetical protein
MIKSILATVIVTVLWTTPSCASDTVTYSYDSLGRLVAATTAGGPNGGISTGITYDPAGNRSNYAVTGSVASKELKDGAPKMVAERRPVAKSAGLAN